MPSPNPQISPLVSGPILALALGILLWREYRKPLRLMRESSPGRQIRNVAVAATAALVVLYAETPVIQPLVGKVEEKQWGLLPMLGLPLWAEVIAALVLMDYTFYVWHVLLHRVPFLWRFHAAHHADRDLDTSTALRFHFGELLLSIPWRAAQVALIGLTPFTFSAWQLAFGLCVLFHHSNAQLPLGMERLVNVVLVTPRMHGIHHSSIRSETDSNWSSGLTCWDWLHGTLRLNVPQRSIVIGVPAYQDPSSVTFSETITIPFHERPDYWVDPSGADRSDRPHPGRSTEMEL